MSCLRSSCRETKEKGQSPKGSFGLRKLCLGTHQRVGYCHVSYMERYLWSLDHVRVDRWRFLIERKC